jgi:hypothetical protein
MSIKDLVDALDGIINDTTDLSSKLKQKPTTTDLRHQMLQEKYANKIPPRVQQRELSENDFFIEDLPGSGRISKGELSQSKPKTSADTLLEALDSVSKKTTIPEQYKRPRQSSKIQKDRSLDDSGEKEESISTKGFINKMFSTGKLGGRLDEAVPYQGEDDFELKEKASSSFMSKMMSTGKLGGSVNSSELYKSPIIEDVEIDGSLSSTDTPPPRLRIDPNTGMPYSLSPEKVSAPTISDYSKNTCIQEETQVEKEEEIERDSPQETETPIIPSEGNIENEESINS